MELVIMVIKYIINYIQPNHSKILKKIGKFEKNKKHGEFEISNPSTLEKITEIYEYDKKLEKREKPIQEEDEHSTIFFKEKQNLKIKINFNRRSIMCRYSRLNNERKIFD